MHYKSARASYCLDVLAEEPTDDVQHIIAKRNGPWRTVGALRRRDAKFVQ
jgi:hypothetical protein